MARIQNSGRNTGNVNWGICTNTSGYEKDGVQKKCSKCMNKEKQAIRASKDFVCEECGEPLIKCQAPKKSTPWAIIIAAIIVIVGGVISAIFIPKSAEPTLLTLNKTQCELTVGECDTIVTRVTPIDDATEVIFQSSNEEIAMVSSTGVVRAIAEGTTMVTAMVIPRKGDTVSTLCRYTVMPAVEAVDTGVTDTLPTDTVETLPIQPKPRPVKRQMGNKLTLSYGTYEGDLQSGQPHGNGIMYFKQRQVIPGTVDCEASAGERVIGTWRDGKINMGTWYRSDGNQVIVKLGQRYNK